MQPPGAPDLQALHTVRDPPLDECFSDSARSLLTLPWGYTRPCFSATAEPVLHPFGCGFPLSSPCCLNIAGPKILNNGWVLCTDCVSHFRGFTRLHNDCSKRKGRACSSSRGAAAGAEAEAAVGAAGEGAGAAGGAAAARRQRPGMASPISRMRWRPLSAAGLACGGRRTRPSIR